MAIRKSRSETKVDQQNSHLASRNEMAKKRIARIKGQIEGIERMFEDGRYCPDIIQQIRSVRAALKGLELEVLERHMESCVRTAFFGKNAIDSEKKLSELIELMKSNS